MPFDSLQVPPEWPPHRPASPERPLSRRDKTVAVVIAALLAVMTLAHCRMLLDFWHG